MKSLLSAQVLAQPLPSRCQTEQSVAALLPRDVKAPAARTKRVLVVDDDLVNRLLARALLEHLGWETVECSDGKEALAVLAKEQICNILLDISLPDISGIELCRIMRLNAEINPRRIVAYTAMAMTSERQVLVAAGFDEILLKPVNLAMMRAAFDDGIE